MEYKFSKTVFSKECILKTVYLWPEKFTIKILEDGFNYLLEITPKNSGNIFDINTFTKELEEQELREKLNLQFGSLRDSIYKKAFEHFEG